MVPVNPPSVINPLLESAVQSASHQLLKSIFLSVITESREARDHAARLLTTEEPADHASARSIDPEASQSEEGHQVVESNDDSNGGLMPNLVLGTADVPCFAPPYFALPTPEVLVNEGEGPNEQLQKRPNATMHPAAEATASKKRSREEAEQPRPPPQPRKRVQRYEACKNCKVEYDVGTNWRYACKWHSGERQLDDEGEAYLEVIDDLDGYSVTEDMMNDVPDAFPWTCCKKPGDVEGCLVGPHAPSP